MSNYDKNNDSKENSKKNEELFGGKFALKSQVDLSDSLESLVHIYGKNKNIVCQTAKRGYPAPGNIDPRRIVIDATEGYIPLWAKNSLLRWRFQEQSFIRFEQPTLVKDYVRTLFNRGVEAWQDAVPVMFSEQNENDLWDFEITISPFADCTPRGCVLASAFFPNSGPNELRIYPTMFEQSDSEQVDTITHEVGHIFGLRHFFANISEKDFPSEIFGTHSKFSIMNYGSDSILTSNDISDLKRLYDLVWRGELDNVNGTPINLVRPYHVFRNFLMSTSQLFS
jgi:hypothetical protein